MSVEFIDFSERIKADLQAGIIAGMEEAAGEIESQTKKNTRVKTGKTKNSWQHRVISDDDTVTAYIGSNYQNAIWEEFGTGERAIPEGGGRKGWPGKAPSRAFWNAYISKRVTAVKLIGGAIVRAMNKKLFEP